MQKLIISNGDTVVNINMNSGVTQSFTISVSNNKIIQLQVGAKTCKQKIDISQNDFDLILQSTNGFGTAQILLSQKKIKISGCTFISKVKFFFL